MKVGLAYDLMDDYLAEGFSMEEAAEFDRAETISGIESTLNELGYETERIGNIKALVRMLSEGRRWDLVFNICEGVYGMGREAQVPALLEAYGIPCTFSDPAILALALNKALTKRIVRDLGIPTPDFAVVECEEDTDNLDLPFPLFAKPVAEGTSKGVGSASLIENKADLKRVCGELLEKFKQPVLVEEFLPGREFTVGIIGTGKSARVLGAIEVLIRDNSDDAIYSWENKEYFEERVEYRKVDDRLLAQCGKLALKAWRGLGCRDCGRMDFRMDADGRLSFLEVNPLAGLNPIRSDLPFICKYYGISYRELIGMIMDSVLERMKKQQ
ncbi:MAG: ATP-grasp domain-containing protein [Clostridiaceae bacterium]|nr:ATP-grasp domain-containing protein [Clostridiaceae bacterium]